MAPERRDTLSAYNASESTGPSAGFDAAFESTLDIEKVLTEGSLRTAFQPICNLETREPIGFEALSRFPAPTASPAQWFKQASHLGLLQALDLHAAATALSQVPMLPEHAFIALNVSPPTAASHAFGEVVTAVAPKRLVLDITAHAIVDYQRFTAAIEGLRALGVRIALDDAGGAADVGLQHLVVIRPDILKIDTVVVHGVGTDEMRQAVASAYVSLAQHAGAITIAEGIETEDEAAMLLSLGVEFGQGYLLGRPEFLDV
jgi:EAL domain-containing protein (putative c-di-GMP-specific phosphodiesterase class I)